MPLAKNKSIKINYKILSEGRPLVLIAGLGSDMSFWPDDFIEKLSKYFKLVLIDNRGTGGSDKPESGYSISVFAEDVKTVLEKENLKKVYLCGISMGGFIAQELTLNYPDLVSKLVILASHCGGKHRVKPDPEDVKKIIYDSNLSYEKNMQRFVEVMYGKKYLKNNLKKAVGFQEKQRIESKTSFNVFVSQMNAGRNYESYSRLPQVECPVLSIQGDEDKLIKKENVFIMQERIKNFKYKIFKGVGHMLPMEAEEELVQNIINFLT